MQEKYKDWLIYGGFAVIYLLIYAITFNELDWLIQWYTAKEINQGIPMYEQVVRDDPANITRIFPAMHFPVFFYMLAFWMYLFGTGHYVNRLLLAFFTLTLPLLMYDDLKDEIPKKHGRKLLFAVYFLNPLFIGQAYIGVFDLLMLFYMYAGIYFGRRNHSLLAALFLFIGTFIKFIPTFGVIMLSTYYLKKLDWKRIISFNLAYFGLCYWYLNQLIREHGDAFLFRTFEWQFQRDATNTSFWFAFYGYDIKFFGFDITTDEFLFFQLGVLAIAGIYILFQPIHKSPVALHMSLALLLALFAFVMRSSYGHYGVWYSLFLIFPIIRSIDTKKWITFWLLVSSVLIYTAGNWWCLMVDVGNCIEDPIKYSINFKLQAVTQAFGIFLILPATYLVMQTEKMRLRTDVEPLVIVD